jgi:DNA-binding NarL/FixJ family response regulator
MRARRRATRRRGELPMPESPKLRLLLVDDQVLFVESLKCVLEEHAADIDIVGTAYDGEEAVALARKLNPDLVLMDVRMPKMDGVQATRRIREWNPKARIVMLTTFDDDEYVDIAMKFGAAGYLLKNIPPDELIRSIRAVRSSIAQISPEIVRRLLSKPDSAGARPPVAERLTLREREILDLIVEAKENREIAGQLGVSEQTVKNHVHNLYEKLGVSNRLQLIKALGNIAQPYD